MDTHPSKSRHDARKKSIYLPGATLREMQDEATRLERSLSWVIQRAWVTAKEAISALPGLDDPKR